MKVLGDVDHDKRDAFNETKGTVSLLVPLGLSEILVGHSRSKLSNHLAHNTNSASQIAATAQYNLSKCTATYATGARLSNGSHPLLGVRQSVAGWNATFAGSAHTAQPSVSGKSTGFEMGVRRFL